MTSQRIVFIRAINVGGTAKLPMADVRSIAESLGATEVRTYIASGNLLCRLAGGADEFDRALEAAILERFGFFRDVISRSRTEVADALASHPFDVIDAKSSYVTFLREAPTAEALAAASALPTGDDRWQVIGRDQHIRYAVSAGQPQMRTDAVARALRVPGTARNLRTVVTLLELTAGG